MQCEEDRLTNFFPVHGIYSIRLPNGKIISTMFRAWLPDYFIRYLFLQPQFNLSLFRLPDQRFIYFFRAATIGIDFWLNNHDVYKYITKRITPFCINSYNLDCKVMYPYKIRLFERKI